MDDSPLSVFALHSFDVSVKTQVYRRSNSYYIHTMFINIADALMHPSLDISILISVDGREKALSRYVAVGQPIYIYIYIYHDILKISYMGDPMEWWGPISDNRTAAVHFS